MTTLIKIKNVDTPGYKLSNISLREDETHDKPIYSQKCELDEVLALCLLLTEYYKVTLTINGKTVEEYRAEVQNRPPRRPQE